MNSQVQIPGELRTHFSQLQILKGLRERPWQRASTGGVNPFTVNPFTVNLFRVNPFRVNPPVRG